MNDLYNTMEVHKLVFIILRMIKIVINLALNYLLTTPTLNNSMPLKKKVIEI